MASLKETSEDSENADLAAVQQLLFSLGQLKFSMRTLSSMHLQSALYSQKETEPPLRFNSLESSAVLEKVVTEVLSAKSNQNPNECNVDDTQKLTTIEDLELVQQKLQEEFERRRNHFISSLSNKSK